MSKTKEECEMINCVVSLDLSSFFGFFSLLLRYLRYLSLAEIWEFRLLQRFLVCLRESLTFDDFY